MRIRWMAMAFVLLWAGAGEGAELINAGFEKVDGVGKPEGWTLHYELDPAQYGGENDVWYRFNDLKPAASWQGRGSSMHCLGFPVQGTWHCPVKMHQRGNGDEKSPGSTRGKAAASQTVKVEAGRYKFSCWLRTREGALWSAAFSLGIQSGPAEYAHDDSTGILWSEHNLGMKSEWAGIPQKTGDWYQHSSPSLEVAEPGEVTVWIRFNYVNDNDMTSRWQADDAELVAVVDAPPAPTPAPIEDTYDDWYDATDDALKNAGFDDGPAPGGSGPFIWKSDGKAELAAGWRGSSVRLSDGALIEQQLTRPDNSRRRKWRAELWARTSAKITGDGVVRLVAQAVDGATHLETYEFPIPPSQDWSYVAVPGFGVPGGGNYTVKIQIQGPEKGSVWVDSVGVERDGRD